MKAQEAGMSCPTVAAWLVLLLWSADLRQLFNCSGITNAQTSLLAA
jgi:hypothetical protein